MTVCSASSEGPPAVRTRSPEFLPCLCLSDPGTASGTASARRRPSAGRTREQATGGSGPRWWVGWPSVLFLFWKNSVSLLFHRFE
jgi:hypothetical protein